MSTASNHMKRSHRSQRAHQYDGMERHKINIKHQNTAAGGYLGFLGRLFRQSKEGDK